MVMDFFERVCYTFAISSKNDIFKEGYPMLTINETRLLNRIHALGAVGIDADGRRTRLAASDEDKAGRDLVSRWMSEAGLTVVTDYMEMLLSLGTIDDVFPW